MLFDLDGFKAYNDTFGHPAGDSLLTRLGSALKTAMHGAWQRLCLGGDEFCILASVGQDGTEPTIAAAEAALTEHGDGFRSPPPTAPSCCPRRPGTRPRPCAWSTSACTPRRRPDAGR